MNALYAELADTFGNLGAAAESLLGNWTVLVTIVCAAFYGIFMGAIPGLTATMAVALLVPLTYTLGPVPAIAAVVTLEACAIFAGDVPTTLLRIPGTPSSAAYADDAYALTRAGRHQEALGVSLVFSVCGGLFGALLLIFLAEYLAEFAVDFTSFEYFWLYLLGLSCAAIVSRGSVLKGALALICGLLLSTVGLSAVYSEARFTFGLPELFDGISFIPAMVGLFGVSEVLRNVLRPRGELGAATVSRTAPAAGKHSIFAPIRAVFGPALRKLPRRPFSFLRSSSIGATIGMLPGAGADIGAWVSVAVSKWFARFSRRSARQDPADGEVNAVADATAANNSALAGAWIPALVFGIPGDSVTAILIGVLYMKNLRPGPDIFTEQPIVVHSIYIVFVVANLLLLPIGFLAIRAGGWLVRIPRRVLLPCVLIFCIVGAYAIKARYFDVWVMLATGVLGFVLERFRVPLGPVVLGLILGRPLEERFIQSVTKSEGAITPFFEGEWCLALGAACVCLWIAPLARALLRRRSQEETPS